MTLFESYRDSVYIKDHVKNPAIIAGDYSYYAGYYHGKAFDECVWYMDGTEAATPEKLIIGKFCSIATGATFMMGGNCGHRSDWVSQYPLHDVIDEPSDQDAFLSKGDTTIGHDVWVGAEAMIMPGVTIGDGAVIGARAVVTRDVEPYTIVAGNPAKPIRTRFSKKEIAVLLEVKWWDWSIDKIRKHRHLLQSGDVMVLRGC